MNNEQKHKIISKITTRNERGQHFTDLYNHADLIELEAEGSIEIDRPVHLETGIPYGPDYWTVDVTDDDEDAYADDWASPMEFEEEIEA